MSDRELLEAAAKAAGYRLDCLASKHVAQGVGPDDMLLFNDMGGHSVWNPRDDDGDSRRLAVKLTINIEFQKPCGVAASVGSVTSGYVSYLDSDPCAATRLAVLRVAAALAGQETP